MSNNNNLSVKLNQVLFHICYRKTVLVQLSCRVESQSEILKSS